MKLVYLYASALLLVSLAQSNIFTDFYDGINWRWDNWTKSMVAESDILRDLRRKQLEEHEKDKSKPLLNDF